MQAVRSANVEPTFDLIVAAGDRVSVERTVWRGQPEGGSIEVEYVSLTEVDAEGRLLCSINFDAEDRELALAEAERRAAAQASQAAGASPAMRKR